MKALINKENFKIPFEYGDTLRLPLPPLISPALNDFSYVDFIGSNNTIDLSPLSGFVDFLLDAKIRVASPTATNWLRTVEVNAAGFLVDKLKILDPNADDKWDDFKAKWNQIKGDLKIEYLGPNTTGYKLYVPVNIYNPNEFPIESTFFTATAKYNESYDPYIMEIKPSDNDKIIPPKSNKKVYLTWQTNFFQGNIMDVFNSGKALPHDPSLSGKFGIDLGYGLMEIPYNFVIPFKFGR